MATLTIASLLKELDAHERTHDGMRDAWEYMRDRPGPIADAFTALGGDRPKVGVIIGLLNDRWYTHEDESTIVDPCRWFARVIGDIKAERERRRDIAGQANVTRAEESTRAIVATLETSDAFGLLGSCDVATLETLASNARLAGAKRLAIVDADGFRLAIDASALHGACRLRPYARASICRDAIVLRWHTGWLRLRDASAVANAITDHVAVFSIALRRDSTDVYTFKGPAKPPVKAPKRRRVAA